MPNRIIMIERLWVEFKTRVNYSVKGDGLPVFVLYTFTASTSDSSAVSFQNKQLILLCLFPRCRPSIFRETVVGPSN